MVWFVLIINTYFAHIVAAMIGVLVAFIMAKVVICLQFSDKNIILNRILIYSLIVGFILLFCATYVASLTDPDFSPMQRYQYAFRTIKNWFLPPNELLAEGGLEKAITLDTNWVSNAEEVFYTIDNKLYSVFTNGQWRKLRYSVKEKIVQAAFSPNAQWLLIKTESDLLALNVKNNDVLNIHTVPLKDDLPKDAKIVIGGMQWSPDSQHISFFVQKNSRVAAQTQWFVYNLALEKETAISLGVYQQAFLMWAENSKRLYFKEVLPGNRYVEGQAHRIKWFEVSLKELSLQYITEFSSDSTDVSGDELRKEGIYLAQLDRSLRFESAQPFVRFGRVTSPSGKSLWVNRQRQLCYESRFGVRYALFGLSLLRQYLNFAPEAKENDLEIDEIRWLPSGKYVLMKHYTHGLLVLSPIKRKVGMLVDNNIGIFGALPDVK